MNAVERRLLRPVIAVALLGLLALSLSSEQLTMTTTYPAPVGVYNQLITTGNAAPAPADTILARNAGNVLLTPPTNANGRVGIGTTTPQYKLDVQGATRLGGPLTLGKNASPPFACDGAHDAAVAITALYTACICRPGAGWRSLGDGISPCVWTP